MCILESMRHSVRSTPGALVLTGQSPRLVWALRTVVSSGGCSSVTLGTLFEFQAPCSDSVDLGREHDTLWKGQMAEDSCCPPVSPCTPCPLPRPGLRKCEGVCVSHSTETGEANRKDLPSPSAPSPRPRHQDTPAGRKGPEHRGVGLTQPCL